MSKICSREYLTKRYLFICLYVWISFISVHIRQYVNICSYVVCVNIVHICPYPSVCQYLFICLYVWISFISVHIRQYVNICSSVCICEYHKYMSISVHMSISAHMFVSVNIVNYRPYLVNMWQYVKIFSYREYLLISVCISPVSVHIFVYLCIYMHICAYLFISKNLIFQKKT